MRRIFLLSSILLTGCALGDDPPTRKVCVDSHLEPRVVTGVDYQGHCCVTSIRYDEVCDRWETQECSRFRTEKEPFVSSKTRQVCVEWRGPSK